MTVETVDRLITTAIAKIEAAKHDDHYIVEHYIINAAHYEELVIEGGISSEYYIKKEAYRRIANKRGYTDEALRAERKLN